MTLSRKLIRQQMKALLVTASPQVADHVFTNRGHPYFRVELPTINILNEDEDVTILEAGPRVYKRAARFSVVISHEALDGVDDFLDDVAQDVEAVLADDDMLDLPEVSNSFLERVEGPVVREEGQRPVASLSLTFAVEYASAVPEMGSGLDLFAAAHVEMDIVEDQNVVAESVDDVTIPQT